MTDEPVERSCAGSVNNHDERETDGEQMIFKAFAFLCAEPVHKKSVRGMTVKIATTMFEAMPKAAID